MGSDYLRGARGWRYVGFACALVATAAITWVAATKALETDLPATSPPTWEEVPVTSATLGRNLSMSAEVLRTVQRTITSMADGTVTGIEATGPIVSGDAVLRIDETPVVIAEGFVPMYRSLAPGSSGADVEQLQRFLIEIGYLSGDFRVDGDYGEQTRRAVLEWERSQVESVSRDGVVSEEQLQFVPEVPARIEYPDNLRVGSRVTRGEPLFAAVATMPSFMLQVSAELATSVQAGMSVTIELPGGRTMAGILGPLERNDTTGAFVANVGLDEPCPTDVCGGVDAGTLLTTRVQVVPETTGPAVPVAAITQSTEGRSQVMLVDGERHNVEVLVVDRGIAIINGVEVGDRVRYNLLPDR